MRHIFIRGNVWMLEVIAVTVAGSALALSILNTYFQFFRKVDDLKVSLLGVLPGEDGLIGDLVFSNSGDRAGTILRIEFASPILRNLADFGLPSRMEGIATIPWTHMNDGSRVESINVGPGELIHERIFFRCAQADFEKILPTEAPEDNSFMFIDVELRFSVVDSSNNRKERSITGIKFEVYESAISGYTGKWDVLRLLP